MFQFKDLYGQECSIQDSSLTSEDAIWVGVDVNIKGDEVYARMHLTKTMAKDLADKLVFFYKNNRLPPQSKRKKNIIDERHENGIQHHPDAIRIMKRMADLDTEDATSLKFGGDGDLGEDLLYLMSEVFDEQAGSR